MRTDVVVVGAGLTGLTTAFWLKKWNVDVHVVETSNRTGGQIQTFASDGFVFETGPTTGSVSTPEVAELMMEATSDLERRPFPRFALWSAKWFDNTAFPLERQIQDTL